MACHLSKSSDKWGKRKEPFSIPNSASWKSNFWFLISGILQDEHPHGCTKNASDSMFKMWHDLPLLKTQLSLLSSIIQVSQLHNWYSFSTSSSACLGSVTSMGVPRLKTTCQAYLDVCLQGDNNLNAICSMNFINKFWISDCQDLWKTVRTWGVI